MKNILNSPTIMTYIAYLVTFGNAILILPLLLLKFNDTELSIWFLLNTIMMMAVLADSGFGATLIRSVSYFYSGAKEIPKNIDEFKKKQKNIPDINSEGVAKLFQTANVIYIFLGIFAILLLLVIGPLLLENIISLSNDQDTMWNAFYTLVVTIFVNMQITKWSSFIQGFDGVALERQVASLLGITKIIVFMVLLLMNYGILSLLIAGLLINILKFITLKKIMKKIFKVHKIEQINIFKVDHKILYSILPSTLKFGAIQAGGYFVNYGTSLIVSQLNSPTLIATFLVTQRIIFFIRQIAQVPIYANLPRVFQLLAKHEFSELKLFLAKNIILGLSMLFVTLSIMSIFGNDILEMMGTDKKIVPINIFLVMAISIMLEYHHAIHAQIYMGSNHIPFLFPALVSGFLILGIGFNVVDTYGLMGIVLTQFFVQLSINNWYPVYLDLKLLNWKLKDYLNDIVITAPKLLIEGFIKK